MTTPEPTPDELPTAVDDSPDDDDTAPEPEPDDDLLDPRARAALQKARREAAGLRARLREAEETIGAAAARATVHHKVAIEAAAAQAGFIDPTDFTLAHPDPSPFLDEQFQEIVGDRVKEAAETLLRAKPHLRRPVGPPPSDRPVEGLRSGARAEETPKVTTWAQALHGR